MLDIVGDRLKKQTHARRKDRMHFVALFLFLGANGVHILYQLIHRFL